VRAGGAVTVGAAAMTTSREPMGIINLEWFSASDPMLGETTGQAGASRQLSLRCGDVHPVTCDAEWTAVSASELVTRAVDHWRASTASLLVGIRASASLRSVERPGAHTAKCRPTPATKPKLPGSRCATCTLMRQPRRWASVRTRCDRGSSDLATPNSLAGSGGERRYTHAEVIALRDSLEAGLSIAAAVDKARGVGTDK
jgi:hypothetical protein